MAEEVGRQLLELPAPDTGSPWLTMAAAGHYLHVSERTLARAIAKGRLRSSTLGRRRLLHRDDLDAFARSGGEGGASGNPLHLAAAEE